MKKAEIEAMARKPYAERCRAYDETLRAIRARIQGNFDDPALMAKGPLSTDTNADVLRFIQEGRY